MVQSRSASNLPDPDRITSRPQLATALRAVKGDRSYHQLLEASEQRIKQAPPRRAGADAGRGLGPERLTKGSVSDWLSGRNLPSRNKLFTFLAVCGVPPEQWRSWWEAVGRARRGGRGRAISDHDPLLLGVHPAIHAGSSGADDGEELTVLTPYVVRDHDQKLRARLRDGCGHLMVVLVGGSSAGKTRACVEAVREVLARWPVVHPATAEELLTLLDDGTVTGTVLWLNETQRYLQPPHGRDVAIALRRVLSTPARTAEDRVVIVGSMWLDPYWHTFTRPPQPGEPDTYAEVRDLLIRPGMRIRVADDFSTATDEQRAELDRLASQDPRLAMAVTAGGEQLRITQTLAGGPLLLDHYRDLAGTPAHAVLTAAMDAHRIGYESPSPATFLEQAVPGYLTPEQRATGAGPGWLTTALKAAAQHIHGVRALTPIRIDETIDEADSYVLHDFLAQHAIHDRRREPLPASLWDAATRRVEELADLRRIGYNATIRRLVNYTVSIHRILADAGDWGAAGLLAELLAERGAEAAVIELLRARADAGDSEAAESLAGLLAERGDEAAVTELRARADAGDWNAAWWLAELLAERGDRDGAVMELRARADAGDSVAAWWLAELLAERGDVDSLRRELYAGNTHHAADALIGLYAAGNSQRRKELNCLGLTAAGDPGAAG
ncbi:MAG: hypothetical protein JO272_04060 [Pseudonocardiales bacterium]|nr:hypothetical protein [Pseudonocardiales bacterium]